MDAVPLQKSNEKKDFDRMEKSSPKFSVSFAAENLAQSQPSSLSSAPTSPHSSVSREAEIESNPACAKREDTLKFPSCHKTSAFVAKPSLGSQEILGKTNMCSVDGTDISFSRPPGNWSANFYKGHSQPTRNPFLAFSVATDETAPVSTSSSLPPQFTPTRLATIPSGFPWSVGMDNRSNLAALSAAYTSLMRGSSMNASDRMNASIMHNKRPPSHSSFSNLKATLHANFQPTSSSPVQATPYVTKSGVDWRSANLIPQEGLPTVVSNLLSENLDSWQQFQQAAYANNLDPHVLALCGSTGCAFELSGTSRRKNATRETTSMLKAWLNEHRKNPYPTKGEKIMLAIVTKMSLTQVSTWFANARRRLKKESKMTWNVRTTAPDSDPDVDSNVDDDEPLDGRELDQIETMTNRMWMRTSHSAEKRTLPSNVLQGSATTLYTRTKGAADNINSSSERQHDVSPHPVNLRNEEPPLKRHMKETVLEYGNHLESRLMNLNNGLTQQHKIWSLADIAHERRNHTEGSKLDLEINSSESTPRAWSKHQFTPDRWLAALSGGHLSEHVQSLSNVSSGMGNCRQGYQTNLEESNGPSEMEEQKQGRSDSTILEDRLPKLPSDSVSQTAAPGPCENPFLSPATLAAFCLYMQRHQSLLHSQMVVDSHQSLPKLKPKGDPSSFTGEHFTNTGETGGPPDLKTPLRHDSQWPLPNVGHQTSNSIKW